ncbi:MAG: hypothetical protein KAU31_12825, partial [Spirochaetaceae bacterium]|nr:hypothetical protein [Spirochaetaceae bacterium]
MPEKTIEQIESFDISTADSAPADWARRITATESSLHQLSPYVGKIKSNIAADLVERYTEPGDLVIDPFCGAGTIPLEASMRGRRVFA